jgi:hypothetical protein
MALHWSALLTGGCKQANEAGSKKVKIPFRAIPAMSRPTHHRPEGFIPYEE